MMHAKKVILLLLLCGVLSAEEDLVVVRKESALSGRLRQQLQDKLAEELELYTRAIIAELATVGSLLEKIQEPSRSEKDKELHELVIARREELQHALVFLQTGVYTQKIDSPDTDALSLSCTVAQDIQMIAAVQGELLQAMRALLERNAAHSFVAARTKRVLDRYVATVKRLASDSRMYKQRIATYIKTLDTSRTVKE